MTPNAVVLIDPMSTGESLKLAAHELGFKVIGVFTQPEKTLKTLYHVKDRSQLFTDCDAVIVSSDKQEIMKRLKEQPFSIRAVIAAIEGSVELTDEIAEELDLERNPTTLSSARRHKGEMRQLLQKSGLSCPHFAVCKSEEEVARFAKKHPFPLLIKTPKGGMTTQIYQCETLEDLIAGFHKIYEQENIFGTPADCAVIEEYIGGQEYIIDTFSDGKKVHITDVWAYEKIDSKAYKNIYYNVFFRRLPDPSLKPILDYAVRVVKAFHIEKGAAHIELKDDPVRGPTLIEIGARLAGVRIPQFVRKYSNCDLFKATIEVFVNGKTKLPEPILFTKSLAIALFPQMKGGKIRSISGMEKIQQLSSYDSHFLNVQVGSTIEPSTHGSSIPLMVYFAHDDPSQIVRDVKAAHELFVIHLD